VVEGGKGQMNQWEKEKMGKVSSIQRALIWDNIKEWRRAKNH
jgi:hypothetical protein